MTEINTRKFYQFLSNYTGASQEGQGATDFIDENYGNGDGYVIKSEFRKFMDAEWNGEENGELTNDLINAFWKKIDTNTSASKISGKKLKNNNALDKNEAANLENKLKLYVEFDNYIKDNVEANIPSDLRTSGSQWVSSVADELTVKFEEFIAKAPKNADGAVLGMEDFLDQFLPTIANKCTAQYCAVEYQEELKSIFADYPEYKVADDATLQKLLDAYIATIDGKSENIYDDVREIMDAYLATAGLKEDSAYDLSELGYNAGQLNDLQLEVIKQTIKNDLADEVKNYEGYEDFFNTAVQDFINDKIKKGGTFEELKAAAPEFATSEFKTKLDNLVTINTTYKDVVEDSEFYKELVTKFGTDLADKIAKNDKYLKFYQDIVTDVINKVNNGDMTMDEVQDYMLEQIAKNLDKFFPNGLGDMSLEELNNMYEQLSAAAEAQEDVEEGLRLHREAAIKYCDALAKKGGKLKEAVVDAFGSDYKSAINKMYPGDIQDIITELKAKVLEIGDASTWTLNAITGTPSANESLIIGSVKSYQLAATMKDAKGNNVTPDSSLISYTVANVSGGSITIDALGKMTITAGTATGYVKASVNIIYDGVVIGKQDISVKVISTQDLINSIGSDSWGGNSEHLEVYGLPGVKDHEKQVTACSFADMYKNNAIILLHRDNNNDTETSLVTERLTSLCCFIANALATTGLDKTKLLSAAHKVSGTLMSGYGRKGKSDDNTEKTALGTRVSEKMKNGEMTGVVKFTDFEGKDYQVNMVSFKEVVDMILKEYGL